MMVVLELCLLPMLSVQAPVQQAPVPAPSNTVAAVSSVDPAAWLPADAMFAVTLRVGDDADLWGITQKFREAAPAGVWQRFETQFGASLGSFGLTPDDLLAIARGGIGFAITGLSDNQEPQFVCVALLTEGSPTLRTSLAKASVGVLTEQSLHGGIYGDYLIVANSEATLDAAVAATRQTQPGGLATSSDYVSACEAAPLAAAPMISFFVRPAALFHSIQQSVPSEDRAAIERAGEALAISTIKRAIVRVSTNGQQVETVGCCSLPPGVSLIGTLLGNPSSINPNLARVVPPEASGFTFASTDLGAAMRGAMDLVQAIEPGAAMMVGAMIDQVGHEADVNIQRAVFEAFTGNSVSFELPSGGGSVIGVNNGAEFAATVDKLISASQVPVKRSEINGVTSYRLDATSQMPLPITFATIGDWLCIAHGDGSLVSIARQLGTQVVNENAAMALRMAPSDTTMLYSADANQSHGATRRVGDEVIFSATFDLGNSTAAIANGQSPAGNVPAPADQVRALQAADTDPASITIAGLQKLAASDHEGVAARATWLLGQRDPAESRGPLAELATESKHAEVRVLAMHALLRLGNVSSMLTGIDRLDDKDIRVRTQAAQLLGKLRQPQSAGPLLAMLAVRAKIATAETPSLDMQAALLALGDLETAKHLLPAATAVDGNLANGTGPALTYYFQSHSKDLSPKDEATLLVAVLGHGEPMLRRYAIGRLGELRDLTTVKALEGRLGVEGSELRPLIEVALAQVRRQKSNIDTASSDSTTASGLLAKVKARWNALNRNERFALGGLAGLCVVLFGFISILVSRQRRARRAAATQSLVAPSDEYLENAEAESRELAEAADEVIDEVDQGPAEAGEETEDADWQGTEASEDSELYDAPLDATDGEIEIEPDVEPVRLAKDDYRG